MLFLSCFASLLLVAYKLRAHDPKNEELFISEEEETDDGNVAPFDFITNSAFCKSEERKLLFVSTIDGKLSCINAISGKTKWTTTSSWPLVSSTISSVKTMRDFADIRFVPSLDGNLYRWTGSKLESIPLSVDYLLGHLQKLPDGSFVTGGKEVVIYGVDIRTGKICYECSLTGCQARASNDIEDKDVILLRRVQNTVRVVQRSSGQEKWNFSVGKFELEYSEKEHNDADYYYGHNADLSNLHFLVQQGVVTSSDADAKWSIKFKSPIAAVWRMENDSLMPVDIFRYGLLEDTPDPTFTAESLMYLGIHEGQMYIQKPAKLENNPNTFSQQLDVIEYPQLIQWRPFVSTSSSRTPSLNKEISTFSSLDYPYDNGFVLVSNFSETALVVSDKDMDENVCHKEGENVCENNKQRTNDDENIIPLSIQDWWKEIVALSIVLAILINVGVRAVKKKFVNETTNVKLESSNEVGEEVGKEETECPVELRKRSKGSSVSIAVDTTEVTGESFTSTVEYTSRYLVDFDHLECLGKGGFGVVFKAKKKIDDCEYAIKRIYLPRCDEAKEKMMREVKALAALDHPGIVRYFHAWWESPPPDWQMKTDKNQLLDGIANDPSYALSRDWLLEVQSVNGDHEVDESGGNNNCLDVNRSSRKKTQSDDPLGKRFNFVTGIEDLISDHKDFDLLSHNDVFFPDDEENDVSYSRTSYFGETNEDSFDIVFENSILTDNPTSSIKDKHVNFSEASDTDESSQPMNNRIRKDTIKCNGVEESEKQEPKKRLVGKCCTLSSSCLTEPPLFLYIQMQLCKQATLKEWLSEKTSRISLSQSISIFMQIVDAVEYFHGLGMMHRDLKPANIFFSLDGSVKIGDFGLVTAITRPSKGKHKGKCFADENHTGQVGTQLYMSPEQASGRPYSQKVDIYSLGLILFELLSHFSTQMERMQLIYLLKHGVLPDELKETNQGNLVKILTAEDPDERLEAKEIKESNLLETVLEGCSMNPS